MIVTLKTQMLSSLEQVRSFLAGTAAVPFATPTHQDRYHWVAQSLKQFGYTRLRRAERGLIVRFLGISELSEGDGTHEVLQQAVPTGVFDVVMVTINFLLQTAVDSVLPLCSQHDVGTIVMMPLNQASQASGLVSLSAARECVRRHIAEGNLPGDPPYTNGDLFDFLLPYPIPEAALRYVLAQTVDTCCMGVRSTERLHANLRAVDPPYLEGARLAQLKTLFGAIQKQVR